MEDHEIEDRLRQIEARIRVHESLKNSRIEQQISTLRSHTDHVLTKAHTLKTQQLTTSDDFFTRQKQYYDKLGKSV
jgi:hypothetical protein